MYFVYNPQGLGDVVLAAVDHVPEAERVVERAGDAVLIRRREDGALAGINLFRYSQYGTWPIVGVALANQERVDRFNEALARAASRNGWSLFRASSSAAWWRRRPIRRRTS